ncbi:MAG: putative Holliday junction resolvase [Arenicella sp.]|jgi:putative Holliday junction resolvase
MRVFAIDYGTKRTGLATTDPLQIICTALETIHTKDLFDFVENYLKMEKVECFVLGHPKRLDGTENKIMPLIVGVQRKLQKLYPDKPVHLEDERFTSKMAFAALLANGAKKKDRREKAGNIDKISATIILQSFMERRKL